MDATFEVEHGIELDIVNQFKECLICGVYDERLPMTKHDTVVYEMAFKFGRADIVIFHLDGSASVIEVKDGTKGYGHVVSGIGQAALYSAQLGMNRGALKAVRKCLLWTSTGNVDLDGVIESTCEQSDTIALPWQSLSSIMATRAAIRRAHMEA